ncbi:MAG TPA: oxidoreductase, partial [Candidatus Acetothermia bacterium]|nr:oxidoreductase [Candidatus Acetothermia bacterium]
MNLRDLARSRRSVRRFRTGPVSDDAIRRIIDAGRLAPSGANRQPWRFV